jgi:heat shock protein HslJ
MTRSLILVSVLALMATGCGAGDPATLDGRDFVLVRFTVNGTSEPLAPGTNLRMSFADGQLTANAGCNTMGGSYALRDGRLVVGDLATTEMGCDPDLHRQDERFAQFLTGNPSVAVDGDELVLEGGGLVATLRLRSSVEPDLPLVGTTWTLTSIIERDAVSSVPGGVVATLRFAGDGSLAVEPGCNSGSGTYALGDGVIAFGPIGMTRMACPGDRDAVEVAVTAVLQGEVDYDIESATLTLRSGDRGLQFSGR